MDPENIEQITAAVVGLGTVGSLAIGFAKRFGGTRFVLAKKILCSCIVTQEGTSSEPSAPKGSPTNVGKEAP